MAVSVAVAVWIVTHKTVRNVMILKGQVPLACRLRTFFPLFCKSAKVGRGDSEVTVSNQTLELVNLQELRDKAVKLCLNRKL